MVNVIKIHGAESISLSDFYCITFALLLISLIIFKCHWQKDKFLINILEYHIIFLMVSVILRAQKNASMSNAKSNLE